jgi:uncharacterized protein YdaU (DUF1376 family)
MKNAPAFQLYAADFYMDTASWPVEEVGMYTRLLFYQWVNGSIPSDVEKIARIAGCISGRKWSANVARMWSNICHKFATLPDGNLANLRLEESRQKQNKFIESQRERANKRWNKDDAGALPWHIPKPCSSSSSSTTKNNPPTPRKRGDEYDPDFLTFWNSYPKKAKKPTAYREWLKLGSRKPDVAGIVSAIQKQKTWRTWIEGYIPDPERWLKGERWTDEEPPRGGNGNGNGSKDSGRPGTAYPFKGRGKDEPPGGFGIPKEYQPENPPIISEEERQRNLARLKELTR